MPVRRMLAVLVTDVGTEDWPAVPRAKAVTTWLVEHGVATATLSSQGYGQKRGPSLPTTATWAAR